jgi:hypothetical protein
LGEMGLIDFKQLGLAPDGSRTSRLDLRQGYATFHLLSSRLEESLQVETPYGTLSCQGEAKFRVDLDQGVQRLEVFGGAVQEESNLGAITVEQDSVLLIQPGAPQPTVVSQGITEDDWDQWVENREALLASSPAIPSPSNDPDETSDVTYGWNDLQQYGTWSNVAGMGLGWRPTLTTNGWAPYSAGQWCWYPGGYTWIGSEPWGWLPYHYGGWDFVPGMGWAWFPGRLTNWSPATVTWFQGPNWIGWVPRPHRRTGNADCGHNCGGGVVSTSTFRHGGVLRSSSMLGLNPKTGAHVREPGVVPSTTAKLIGAGVSFPAAHGQGVGGTAHAGVEVAPLAIITSPGSGRSDGGAPSHSTIIYDPQKQVYINSRRVARPQGPTVAAPGSSSLTPTRNPGLTEPAPIEIRGQAGQPVESQQSSRPSPGVGVTGIRPAQTVPRGNEVIDAAPPKPAGPPARQGAWGVSGGHPAAQPQPSGGGRTAPAPAPASGAGSGHH